MNYCVVGVSRRYSQDDGSPQIRQILARSSGLAASSPPTQTRSMIQIQIAGDYMENRAP